MTDPAPPSVALSVKQPWAALLAAGVKSVEVRTWPTTRRGPVYLHAAKVPDDRPHGWTFIDTPTLIRSAELLGGVIAVADLADCVAYETAEAFAADAARHRNLPSWFRPPVLYGFVFENVRPVTFAKLTGNTFFFPVGVSSPVPLSPGGEGLGVRGTSEQPASLPSDQPPDPNPPPPCPSPSGERGSNEIQLPPPAERVIIIDPPEGKDARHHDHPDAPQDRPAG